ncbi:Metallo-hydrolase/oxidoreductase [Polychaeton citri CBS 116435]|uniref:Metallo-hydrolase/oxidoreductase n=1 Tax=Polychaeton citri CBS 116435 TaxID=1314669 RepID=A0A9P4Q0J3_9PEZI|nr:Metallo-hydrolase/oxidoreductase [Polychaeton citri CBS 116435]
MHFSRALRRQTLKASYSAMIEAKRLPPVVEQTKSHHVGSPPTSFTNPWPSSTGLSLGTVFKARFGNSNEKNFVPVPQGLNGQRSDELVQIKRPDWAADQTHSLRATWIGHASFLVETPTAAGSSRGIRVLFDPVWSERTSPFSFLGPKRYSPPPCTIADVPDVDIICISHNHYDHQDYHTLIDFYKRRKGHIHFLVALGNRSWFLQHIQCSPDEVTELDWWDGVDVTAPGVGEAKLTCVPCQHGSARTPFDRDRALWCSWVLETSDRRKLYFSGDTAYQAVDAPSPCPAFKEIGDALGPMDLALLPIGLMMPPSFMANVHASPEQSLRIHKEVRSKLSIGMHYGTVRGGVSEQYEDVREPPQRWRAAAEKEGIWAGGGIEGDGGAVDVGKDNGIGLCHIGETVCV